MYAGGIPRFVRDQGRIKVPVDEYTHLLLYIEPADILIVLSEWSDCFPCIPAKWNESHLASSLRQVKGEITGIHAKTAFSPDQNDKTIKVSAAYIGVRNTGILVKKQPFSLVYL
jgi:hypothetical protein